MENHVFYKTTVPHLERDAYLLHFLEEELKSVYNHIASLGFFYPQFSAMPMVVLNNQKGKSVTYGSLDLKTLFQKIKQLEEQAAQIPTNEILLDILQTALHILEEHINHRLSKEEKQKLLRLLHDEVSVRLTDICWESLSEQEKEILEALLATLRKTKTTMTVTGEYIAEQNLIVIYYQVIKRIADKTNRPAEALYRQTLAHEMYHACHCFAVGETAFCASGGRSREMKIRRTELYEAMADFYSVFYLISTGSRDCFDVAKDRYDSWCENLFISWPYAKALYFLKGSSGFLYRFAPLSGNQYDFHEAVFKLHDVFSCVKRRDINQAYRILTEE